LLLLLPWETSAVLLDTGAERPPVALLLLLLPREPAVTALLVTYWPREPAVTGLLIAPADLPREARVSALLVVSADRPRGARVHALLGRRVAALLALVLARRVALLALVLVARGGRIIRVEAALDRIRALRGRVPALSSGDLGGPRPWLAYLLVRPLRGRPLLNLLWLLHGRRLPRR
jgi:hypothetical protein